MEKDDRRSMSPGREKRVRVVPLRDPGKLSTKSPRLTSKGDRTLRDLLRDYATDKRAFINTSTILVDLYMIPIKARKILNDKELEEMFCNIRQIITAEQQALKIVEEELRDDEADVIGIVQGMLENLNSFGTYCRNLPKAISLLVKCRKTPPFIDFEKNRLQANTLGLDNLMSYPFEQVKRYDRILADWVPFFRSTELYPEFEVNRSRILDYVDALRKQVDGLIDKQKVVDVIATIDPSSINCELYTAATAFVKEGVVQLLVKQLFIAKKEKGSKVKFSKKPEEVLLYLFSDSILVLKRKKNNKNNNKKKRAVELYDNKLLARIPLATSRFIVVSNATSQKVLQFVHEGLSYAFLFDNERTWREWQKKIKAQVKESMKKKIQKDEEDHPIDLPKSRHSKRGVEWGKKYHTMDSPQQLVVKTEVNEVPMTPRNSEFQERTPFHYKHRTTSFNSPASNDVKLISHAPEQRNKSRDSTFEVFLRPRAFTIASTEYSIVPESFPVVEEPEFGSTSFNSLKWAKVLNVEVDSPVNSPLNSPSAGKSLMSPRISALVKKFSSDIVSPRSNENNTNVIDLKPSLSLPTLGNPNASPIDQLSPRSLSNLYRPDSLSPRGRNQVVAPADKLPAVPPRPSLEVDVKPNAKGSLEIKPDEVTRGANGAAESPIGARKLLGRSGSIMIGGRANTINTGPNSSSNSTPKISPRSVTDPSLNIEAINDAGNGSASVSSPSLARGGWTRVASSGNISVPGLNKNLKNSDEQARETLIGTRGSGSPRGTNEVNNTNVVFAEEVNSIVSSLKNDIDDFDYDPDWQFGFTQDGRMYYYNTKLNQRTWERPKNIMPNPILDDVNAPHNWREMFSPQGYVYYLNSVTKQTSWFRTYLPAQHAQLLSYYNSLLLSALRNKRAENGATSPLASPKSPHEHTTDGQWKEVVSPDGRHFYFNELTQTASWNPPTNVTLLTALSQTNSIVTPPSDEKKTKRKKSKS